MSFMQYWGSLKKASHVNLSPARISRLRGPTMNKIELVKRVAEKLEGLPKKTAAKAVDAVFESIAEGLQEDGVVTIGKWGTYSADDIADK